MTTNERSDDDDAEHQLPKVMIYHHSDQLELISCFTEDLLLWIVRKDMGLYMSSRNRFVGQRWSHCMRRTLLMVGWWDMACYARQKLFPRTSVLRAATNIHILPTYSELHCIVL